VVTPLAELQAAFQDHLLNGSTGISQAVLANAGLDVARRLNIYHHAYRARLVEALRDSYGHTASYLGDEQFDAVARAYLAAHPSLDPNLRWFGVNFSEWAAAEHAADPELSELAALDWALRRAFDASDATPLALSDLARVPPEAWAHIGFVFHPTCARLVLRHNTLAIWHALDQDAAPPAAEPLAPRAPAALSQPRRPRSFGALVVEPRRKFCRDLRRAGSRLARHRRGGPSRPHAQALGRGRPSCRRDLRVIGDG
jgi:hypothetical protein